VETAKAFAQITPTQPPPAGGGVSQMEFEFYCHITEVVSKLIFVILSEAKGYPLGHPFFKSAKNDFR
jgi:hypothetical protein